MRESSPGLAAAFAAGATSQGADVVEVGLASTDLLYFAAGSLDVPGRDVHREPQPGALQRHQAVPGGRGAGRPGHRAGRHPRRCAEAGVPAYDGTPGTVTQRDLLGDYAAYLQGPGAGDPRHPAADGRRRRRQRDGRATVPAGASADLPLDVTAMYFELDGSFPNHEANPIDPANLRDLQAKVREVGADIGLAFDGDADRCFVVDERGEIVSPSVLTALIAVRELGQRARRDDHPQPDHVARRAGDRPRARRRAGADPGRALVHQGGRWPRPARSSAASTPATSTSATSGGPTPGMLAALHVLAALGSQDGPLSDAARRVQPVRRLRRGQHRGRRRRRRDRRPCREAFERREGATVDDLDGLTVDLADGSWFNLRPSNTEPLLRLNVEAPDEATIAALRDEVLAHHPLTMSTAALARLRRVNLDPALLEILACPNCRARPDASTTRRASWSAPAAATPIRCATTSRCC